jgi:hypothetical protein
MKKIFLMMAFVAMTLGAAAQENSFNVKGGVGLSTLEDYSGATSKLNWKIGAGYEFRLNDLIGIEPSLMLNSKGYKTDYDLGGMSSLVDIKNETINLLYVEVPVMCNFHINDNWELGAGVYGAYLVDDNSEKDAVNVIGGVASAFSSVFGDDEKIDADDFKAHKVDFGAYAVAKYNFENGLFVGLDYSYGFGELSKYNKGKNMTFGALVGFRF